MAPAYASLLQQLKVFIAAYLAVPQLPDELEPTTTDGPLQWLIRELEDIQKHPEQRLKVERLAEELAERAPPIEVAQPVQPDAASNAAQALATAFGTYIDDQVAYLAGVSNPRREQLGMLLGDLIADLRTLALHSSAEQALLLAGEIDSKRAELMALQRPWQIEQGESSAHDWP